MRPPDPGPFAPLLADLDARLGVDLPAAHHLGPRERSGRLEQTDLALLVGEAYQRTFSGRLLLEADAGLGGIWFEAGRPVDAAGPTATPAARLEADPALVENWLFLLGTLGTGRYTFQPRQAGEPPHRVQLLRPPAALVNGLIARRAIEDLERWRGSERNRWQLQPGDFGPVLAAIPDDEVRAAMALFDGSRGFAEVAAAARLGPSPVLRAAYLLFCFGALAPGQSDADEAPGLLAAADHIRALFALASESDYFTFLGVDREASAHEIAHAAKRMAARIEEGALAPEVAVATTRERATIAQVLAEARRVLGHATLRARYGEGIDRSKGL